MVVPPTTRGRRGGSGVTCAPASLPCVATPIAALVMAGKRIPWARVVIAAKWLYERGKDNLTDAERRELGRVLRKSKGDPRKITVKERERMRALVVKGVRGK